MSASDIKCLSKCYKSLLFSFYTAKRACCQIIQSMFHINLLVWHSQKLLLLPNGMLALIKSCLIHITQNKADHYKYHDTFQWYNNIQISRGGVHRRKEKILPLVLKKKNIFYRDGRCTTITHAYISMTYSGILHIYCISRQALLVHAL